MKKYLVCGSHGAWLDYAYECDSLEEAKRIAYRVLRQGEVAGIWDVENNCHVLELTLRYDGLGVS